VISNHRKKVRFPMRRFVRNLAFVALFLLGITGNPRVHAQSNAAIAQQLFLDGERLMKTDHIAEACGKFADSQRLDPAIGTLMHLAVCHEKMGKLATAWSEFTDLAGQAQRVRQREREDFARQHAAALDPKLQKIIIELSHPPDGTTIKLDDAPLPLGVLGTEVPLDPGDHSLEVTAPGMKPWRQAKLNMGPSAVVTRVQVTLEEEAPVVAKSLTVTPTVTTSSPEPDAASTNTTKLIIGIGAGVLGLASGIVAIDEAVTSAGRSSDESKYAGDPMGQKTVANQASEARTFAIIFGSAAAVAIGAGVYFVVTSHGRAPAASVSGYFAPLIGPGLAGAELHFTW
jgi:hypothetical protein